MDPLLMNLIPSLTYSDLSKSVRVTASTVYTTGYDTPAFTPTPTFPLVLRRAVEGVVEVCAALGSRVDSLLGSPPFGGVLMKKNIIKSTRLVRFLCSSLGCGLPTHRVPYRHRHSSIRLHLPRCVTGNPRVEA